MTCAKCESAIPGIGNEQVILCPLHALTEELVEALRRCQDEICYEKCAPGKHYPLCDEVEQVLVECAAKEAK